MKKMIIISISAAVLCLSGCFGIATAGKYPYNGSDQGALQIQYPYPDQGQDQNQQNTQQQEQPQHREQDRP